MRVKRNIEIWKDIKGFTGYQISNMGRVMSFKNRKPLLLSIRIKPHGYCETMLRQNNSRTYHLVHLLVIHHFGLPKPSPEYECNHIDGDKSNNWNTNLEWLTHKENMEHAVATGLKNHKGENAPFSKLTQSQVTEIKQMHRTGKYTYAKLGKIFNVHQTTIGHIITNLSWKK